ncbi:fluoride efflux transporter FluC [Bifidobacterium moukalabense]|uniref:Fluoride-specific ion channel FluC n=1 Tax=Bifidobacterium moukalabense DSM 27321 TaxID=1435051 RepID=W4N8U0_9BIFI|nr:CrcB family protein [Bifidobacterium moukalabense]ETY71472.1 camphor resistance protein CrcB [Bifidobacterium moukalabense DSM 27321]
MNAILPILVCLCGGIGASARYICDAYIRTLWHRAFPMSTFVINVVAGFLAGVVAGLSMRSVVPQASRLLLATGFLGGFSTFSTMMNEAVTLLRGGRIAAFVGYFVASAIVPVVAVACGYMIAE